MTNTQRKSDDDFVEYIEKCLQELSRLTPFITKELKADLEDLQNLLGNRRSPRFMLVGRRGAGKSTLINAIFNRQVAKPSSVKPGSSSQWLSYDYNGDHLDFLDTRGLQEGEKPAEEDLAGSSMKSILNAVHCQCPDVVLFLCKAKEVSSAIHSDLDTLEKILKEIRRIYKRDLHIIGIITQCDELDPVGKPINNPQKQRNIAEAVSVISTYITSRKYLQDKLLNVISVVALVEYHENGTVNENEDNRWQIDTLTSLLLEEIPKEARFYFARLARVRQFQNSLAEKVVRVSEAISGGVAFPLMAAGMPVVATVRAFMIGTIMFISGKEVTSRSVREFIIAQGLSIGVSNSLEVITLLGSIAFPGVGNVVFGASAVVGTNALGCAAIDYFIKPLLTEQNGTYWEVNASSKLDPSKTKEPETKGADYYDEFA